MAEASFGFEGLHRLVVTDGPGTFTGQRVGIAAARALSLATGASVHVLSSLAVMAYGAAETLADEAAGRIIAVAVDARRGEVYFQAFEGAGLAALGEPELLTPAEAVQRLGGRAAVAVGSGAALVAEAAGGSVTAALPTLEPDVRFIPSTVSLPPSELPRPRYLRPPDAKPQDGASLVRPI
jgi:tRNA threonylcarbamoyladenosine biosynthesis protein TsaB